MTCRRYDISLTQPDAATTSQEHTDRENPSVSRISDALREKTKKQKRFVSAEDEVPRGMI